MRGVYIVKDNKAEYHPILTRQEYLQQLDLKNRGDGYPLRVEVKRDRWILNSQAMKQAMERAVDEALTNIQTEIIAFYQNQAMDIVRNGTEEVLNSINYSNGRFTTQKPKGIDYASMIGKRLGKALADDILYIFNDIFSGRNTRRKKKRR